MLRMHGLEEHSAAYLAAGGNGFDGAALGRRIRLLRESLERTQTDFAGMLGVDQSTVARWESGRTPKARHVALLASLAGLHPMEFIYGRPSGPGRATAPVVGYVGAGQQVFTIDDHALGAGLDEVESLVSHASGGPAVVAVRIRGDSMHPMKDGWLLFYTRDQDGVPAECVGRLCVLQVADDGPALVKEIRRGYRPGTFTLASWNAPPMEDVTLAWAAPVLAIRPA